jgi:hypothetical protein
VTPRPATLQAAVRRATRSAPMRKRRS